MTEDLEEEAPLSEPFQFSQLRSVRTDIGRKRTENQDSHGFLITPDSALYVVADGMGGAKGGATASIIAVGEILQNAFDEEQGVITEQSLRESVQLANKQVYAVSRLFSNLSGMGTTVVALVVRGEDAFWAHVGDSRLYMVRDGQISQLTKDHTLVQELVDSGIVPKDRAANHPIGHMLTRALGQGESLEIDLGRLDGGLRADDCFILCCDGLTGHVSDVEICEMAERVPIGDLASELVNVANSRGGHDNITVIALRLDYVDEDAPLPKPELVICRELTTEEEEYIKRSVGASGEQIAEAVEDAVKQEQVHEHGAKSAEKLIAIPSHRETRPAELSSPLADERKDSTTQKHPGYQWRPGRVRRLLRPPPGLSPILVPFVFASFILGGIIFTGVIDIGQEFSVHDVAREHQVVIPRNVKNPGIVAPDSQARQSETKRTNSEEGVLKASGVHVESLESLANFKELLRERVAELNMRIRVVELNSKEMTNNAVVKLRERLKFVENLLREAEGNLASVQQRYNVWIGYRSAFESKDAVALVDVADRIGAQDQGVQRERERYKELSLRYFQVVEKWNENNSDLLLQASMESLGLELRQSKESLETVLRQLINRQLLELVDDLADWTIVISGLKKQKQRLSDEISLALSSSPLTEVEIKSRREFLVQERDKMLNNLGSMRETLSEAQESELRRLRIVREMMEKP